MSKPYTITFAGDTSLGDGYLNKPKRKKEKERLETDPYSFFEEVASFVNKSDYSILNLETVLAHNPSGFLEGKQYPNWDSPQRTIDMLKSMNVDAVSLANNHTMDYGESTLVDTINELKNAGISYFGAGQSSEEAVAPLKIEVPGTYQRKNVYVLTGMKASRRYRVDYNFFAQQEEAGVNSLNENRLIRKISSLKEKDSDAIVIVCPHWQGLDYKWVKETEETRCRSFVEAGADLVIAHGTHMANHIEKYKSGIIAYSIGNFVFNSPGRYKKMQAPPYSFIANLIISESENGWDIQPAFYPIVTDNKETGFRVRFVTHDEAVELFKLLNDKHHLGVEKDVVKKDGDRYYFDIRHTKTSDEVDQLLLEHSLNSSTNFPDDLESFKEETYQLEHIQSKIDEYLFRYYQKFNQDKAVSQNKAKLQSLADVVEKRHISHNFLKKFERKKIPVTNSFSFREIMVEKSAMRKLGYRDYAWTIDRKTKAYVFADSIGLRTPKSDREVYRFDELKGKEGPIVVKPVGATGSKGVYLIFDNNKIFSAREEKYLSNWDEIEAEMQNDLDAVKQGERSKQLVKDEWFVEELILKSPDSTEPPLDYKFYCFYGELLFVLEANRMDSSQFSTWDANGHFIKTGWHDEKARPGVGFSQEDAEITKKASLEIPSPFVRFDMLKGHDGLVFGEATPRPGGFHLFNKEYDRKLGQAYREAEARLTRDLLRGKKFEAFTKNFKI
ncbi:CapA family protein [Salicibibacter cibarius]|uniref:CapA family protein n=1 Tax=Salicibibacter cibarius TaxID=2743000 RepID=A0A7T6YZH5_9BACI|nr:CapA family protein [Salicibibacter cibarius]QQK74191.1 CapA family protein [Salicibibacter cibarius]